MSENIFLLLSCFVALCSSPAKAMGALSPLDPSSYSRPELAIIKHIALVFNVDFEKRVLEGNATLHFNVLKDIDNLVRSIDLRIANSTLTKSGANASLYIKNVKKTSVVVVEDRERVFLRQPHSSNEEILDVSKLNIESVEEVGGPPLQFKLDDHVPNFGSKLTIQLPQSAAAGALLQVRIKYSTDPSASALQWLDAPQTSGQKYPYMFSQCQPIHARSILPCQDSPAVKFTYEAEVTAPAGFTVLMSALRGEVINNTTSFKQPMPLPSYLVAIAVGVIESRPLGPRSRVWAEKEEIERSAWEFADTEKYLKAAERLCGPYEWTEYDLLVLPPSFPYGGMENPCLTFVTPTLLAGDKSQADVIVHEIMHSWTGNLVTNRNFEHFWLNEGFTVYLERKVAASLISDPIEAKKSRDFHSLLGLQELAEAVETFGANSPLTNLVVNLTGVHPDDAFSRVPYEKGSLFLRYLEELVDNSGVFEEFLRSYLAKYRKQSLDTEQFRSYLLEYFKDNEKIKKVDWDAWLHTSGMPPVIPNYDTSMTKAIKSLVDKIYEPNAILSYEDVKSFTPHQIIHFLQELIEKPPIPIERLRTIGNEYRIVGNNNTEIRYRWSRLCVRSKDPESIDEVFKFLNSNGRMKYVRPLYRELYSWEEVRKRAIDNFLQNEKNMMHVSAYTIRKDLHLTE